MDRFAAIEAFVAVAEARSFTAAAAKLGATKSAVSRLVGQLEAQLGARLFHRTTRSLTLTEAGESYFERGSRILQDLQEADSAISQLQAAPRGRLRVSAPMSFGFLHLAPALHDFLERFPDLTVDLSLNDRFVDLVEEGFDLAVRIGIMEDSSLVAKKLAPIRRAICGSPAYFETRPVPATPEDLKLHNCLCYSNAPTSAWRFIGRGGKSWNIEVKGRLTANNGDALRAAALKGAGVVNLPTFITGPDIRDGRLVSVLEKFTPQDLALYAIYPHGGHLSPKVRAFVDYLAERFRPQPYWD